MSLLHAPANHTPAELPVIRGIDGAGRPHTVRVTPELEHITLSGLGLRSVSLAPLSLQPAPAMLREVSLAANALQSIDLAPLSSCKELTVLTLNSNRMKEVDLSPLAACTKLERLWLHDNLLNHVDLAPLQSCTALRSLYLEDNAINDHPLDISPLKDAKQLRSLRLGGNTFGGSLDITPLLQIPALSQFHVSTDVKLRATGESHQARISPALRKCVLDITFHGPASNDFVEKAYRTPSKVSPIPRRATPPYFSSSVSGALKPRASRCGSPSPLLLSSTNFSSLKNSLSKQNHGPCASAPPVISALLVGFRRLSRYSVEDALSRRGRITIRAVELDTALQDPSTVLDSHVVIVQTPSEKSLKQLLLIISGSCAVFVFGSERYRARNLDMLTSTVKDVQSCFVPDPLSEDVAQLIFSRGVECANSRTKSNVVTADSRFGRQRSEPDLGDQGDSPKRSSAVTSIVATDSMFSATSPPSPSVAPEVEAGSEPFSAGGDVEHAGLDGKRPNLQELPITLELDENPPLSMWTQISERLRSGRLSADERTRYRLAGSPRLSPSASCSSNLMDKLQCPELKRHGSNKLRAERAALELVFHDLGDSLSSECFAGIARTCGLPKCAGYLLFCAALESAKAVESTTPESGVPEKERESPPQTGVGKEVPSETFMQYWEARLQPFDSDSRLFNVLMDASLSVYNSGPPLFHHPRSLGVELALGSDVDRGSALHKSKSVGYKSRPKPHSTPRALCRGCNSGIEALITGFMQGRSTRFGMFSLVKMPEAIALGTALMLLALQSESESRVGGCARSISSKEVCSGSLNASLIAAEAGVFEGVAACLSMDSLREIKGHFAAEASPEALVASEGCALKYNLQEEEFVHYNMQRNLLLRRGVRSLLGVHCGGRSQIKLTEFAVFHKVSNDLKSNAAADYFFSVIDFDQDEFWCLADIHHFLVEKEKVLVADGIAMCGLKEIWFSLLDMIQPADIAMGISRNEFLRLTPKERKVIIQSILFVDDDHATLNIRKTMKLEGGDIVVA